MGNVPDAAGNVSDETHGLMTECTRGLNSDRDEVVCPGYGDVLCFLSCLRQVCNCPCLTCRLLDIGRGIGVRACDVPH